jgi:hypothetical protein
MSIAQRIAAKRADMERNVVEVPEWGEGGVSLRLYSTHVSVRDLDKIQRKHPNFLSNVTMAGMVEMIIMKCEQEGGEPAFTLEDKPVLMGEPISVIAAVFAQVFSSASIEDQVKN